ncbi:hypothetical protein OAK57_04175, partial [Synechococcus sp. AH-551-N23]|nr:hypothetical protein [Synechococcus sp. AH-551-N23]
MTSPTNRWSGWSLLSRSRNYIPSIASEPGFNRCYIRRISIPNNSGIRPITCRITRRIRSR